jgi:hypothetical protein
VAVKVLLPELAEKPAFAERFEREARAMARLNHPNIVQVHDYGRAGSLFYLVLEHVDGTRLRDAIRAGAVEPVEALRIVREVCDALEFAHEAGVVHRDIKPENILLDRRGRTKIADFGLAKLAGGGPQSISLTSSGQVMGTLRYMAPEQLDRPLEVDHRADIYSLGVVFYEMLTGELPVGSFAPPSDKVEIDVRVDQVVLKSLAKEPQRRYQHASEVRTDVERLGTAATGPLPQRESRELCLWGPAGLAVAVGTLFVVGAGLFVTIEKHMRHVEQAARLETLYRTGHAPASALLPSDQARFGLTLCGIVLFGLFGLAACAWMGWRGLRAIQRDWPRRFGIGAALTALWLPVLLVANQLLIAAVLVPLDIAGDISELNWMVPPIVLAALGLDAWFLVRRRARFLRQTGGP